MKLMARVTLPNGKIIILGVGDTEKDLEDLPEYEDDSAVIEIVPYVEPYIAGNRYPKHDSLKGQLYLGECNITRCTNRYADYYNKGTRGYYCVQCARGIDEYRDANFGVIVGRVEWQLSREEQDAIDKHKFTNNNFAEFVRNLS